MFLKFSFDLEAALCLLHISMSTYIFTVSLEDNGKRLDKFLAEKTEASRTYITQLLSERGDKSSRKVVIGEEVWIDIPEAQPLDLTPWDFPLDVIFEDDQMLVINKPVGLTVHPAPGNYNNTLVHALLHHCNGSLSGINGVERPGIVHRLDKDTSGVMVIAKTDDAHRMLSKAIESRRVLRFYKAFVHGVPNPPRGEIKTRYGRHPRDRKKMTVLEHGGKRAITEYKVLEVFGRGLASLVECKLQTGRTHQIRVHMQHLKNNIIGDATYSPKRPSKLIPAFGRQALHAYKLIIPDVGEFVAELPEDMEKLSNELRDGSSN